MEPLSLNRPPYPDVQDPLPPLTCCFCNSPTKMEDFEPHTAICKPCYAARKRQEERFSAVRPLVGTGEP